MAKARAGEPPSGEKASREPSRGSNLALRIASAAVAAPILIALLYKGPPWAFYALAFPASLVGAWELFNMTHAGDRPSQAIGVVVTAMASLAMWFSGSDVRILVTLVLFVPLLGPLLTLLSLGEMKTAALRACAMGFGPLYVGIPLTALALLRKDLPDGAGYVVVAILFAWFGDTGGYFGGRFFGKHKLYEAVSPKKTTEGAMGGLVGSVFAAVLAHAWFLPSLPLGRGIVLALVAGVLGQAGDLGESLLKRSTGIKDSGAIVPGHGGILDRVDALLVTSAVTYTYSLWFLK